MSNYLKMPKRQQVIALLELGWTYRRIEAETGVRRETVSRYDRLRRSNPAKVFPGSDTADPSNAPVDGRADPNAAKVTAGSPLPPRSAAAPYHDTVVAKLEQGLTAQRIWQDLVEDEGYAHSYESIKRYVRRVRPRRKVVGVFHSAPGEEAQVDFFQGAPTLSPATGEWKRPWVFRMTLCHSRHGYEEAVWDQQLETFLRLHERAFTDLGGVPRVVRHDNLKAAVVRACFFDPDSNDVYAEFARYWGFTPLPTQPAHPQENGKQERSGGYVKSNALKGRRFDSLDEQNQHLRRWNRTIARLRIHGTTRKQVFAHFLETDKPALQPLALEPFPYFESGQRKVHPDGHVEVKGAFYPVAAHLLGETVQVRWDRALVRVHHQQKLVAVHQRVGAGRYAPRPGGPPVEAPHAQRAFVQALLGRCERVGEDLRRWAEAAFEERDVRAIRLVQGVLGLARTHTREQLLYAARHASESGLFRLKTFRRLADQAADKTQQLTLLDDHPSIRPMTHYRLEDL